MLRRINTVASLILVATFASQNLWSQTPVPLTLNDAKTMALANHPHILGAQSDAAASAAQAVASRSPYYPTIDAAVTGSQGTSLGRVGAGSFGATRLFDRLGQGLIVSQLLSDSGRTKNLSASAQLQAEASTQIAQATRADVLLDVYRAYFGALHAQAMVRVAEATVSARQLFLDQVTTLANNNLKSQLDVSFASVSVSEAQLLLLRARDSLQSSLADLTRAIGADKPADYRLAEEPLPQSPPATPDTLAAEALNNRPELASLKSSSAAAKKFADAEEDLSKPTLTLLGTAGFVPFINRSGGAAIPKAYEGVAVNFDLPVFNGHLFSARRDVARNKADSADQRLRDAQERVVRDVRVAWASAMSAYQRMDVTAQLLRQATLGLDLAQGRYNLGLASIVELTQSQLNVTQAEIENLSAKYEYQAQNAILQYSAGFLR